ncbi:MAG: hypothetical protein WAW87_03935 [Candidatus Ferrigenium altingense]
MSETVKEAALLPVRSNAGLGLRQRIDAHLRQLAPHMMQRDGVVLLREAKQEIEILGAAIVAMAEDGWLYHGVEGMDEAQTKCYEAYLRVKPNEHS